MKFDRSPPDDAAIAQGLASLKRQGGTVLVVGAATPAHADVCERFVGDTDDERVIVRIDRAVHSDEEFPEATVIDRPVSTRGASAVAASSPVELESLAADVEQAIRAAADGKRVRVCVDSLRPLADGADHASFVSFLERVRAVAHDTGAIVHFHLPAMAEAIPASLFDTVDAVLEVEGRGHATYQRWRLPEAGKTSEWVEI